MFYIIDNENYTDIIIGYGVQQKFSKNIEMPILCAINTGNKGPISWDRLINNLKDIEDFWILVNELEQAGVIEEKTVNWVKSYSPHSKNIGEIKVLCKF